MTTISGAGAHAAWVDTDRVPASKGPFTPGTKGYHTYSTLKTALATAVLAAGVLTASAPFTVSQTWDDGGGGAGVFIGASVDITNMSSASTSQIERWRVGGTTVAHIDRAGSITSVVGNIVAGNNIQAAAGSAIKWNGRGNMQSPLDGVIAFYNTAATDFGRLQFGGTTSSFPALKRSSTALHARLADDSAYAPFSAELVTVAAGTATPANGSAAASLRFGTTSGFGIYYGSGSPNTALTAAQGSLYIRSDGTGVADRAYINTDGSTAWTAIATAG